MVIKVNNLHKRFEIYKRDKGVFNAVKSLFNREKVIIDAVENLNLDIDKGEKVAFLGPNGAGKSTTIKMLTGILHPTSGNIEVLGYNPWKNRKDYVNNIGVIFGQKSQMWIDLPPLEAFNLHKHIYKIPEDKFNERLEYMASKLDVKEVMLRPTRNLSLGERMKCEFISALLHNPSVVFLDEPTIGVDALSKDTIRTFIKDINKEFGTTFILTTHDMDDIENLCDRVIIIDEGKILFDGGMKKLFNRYITSYIIKIELKKVLNAKKFDKLKESALDVQEDGKRVFLTFSNKLDQTTVLKNLLDCVSVHDIKLSEPKLEDIIKKIYTKKE